MAKPRTAIPASTAAAVLFASDRTCCVCRNPGQAVQIHHLDEDPTNHSKDNLAVLCLECHQKTQMSGGFARSLDADQVRLYRDDWLRRVAAERSLVEPDIGTQLAVDEHDPELVTSLVEINREAENFVNLAFVYSSIGNAELRDRAIADAIARGVSDHILIMLRRIQGRLDAVPADVIEGELERLASDTDEFRSRAQLLADLGRYREGVAEYLTGIGQDFAERSDFNVAFLVTELFESGMIEGLFVQAFQEAADEDDLFWQVRALEELGWTSELDAFVLEREAEIRDRADLSEDQRLRLEQLIARAKGDDDAFKRTRKALERIDAEIEWE